METSYQIYIDKKTIDQNNIYRVFVGQSGSICSVNAFVDQDAHGKIYHGKVAQIFSNGKAKVQIDTNAILYAERSFKEANLNVGESVWVQAHSISPTEMEHKDLKGTLNIALPCGPVILYPFEPGVHISHRLKQYPEFAHNLKLQFAALAGRFGVKFRLSAKDYSFKLLEHIISFSKTVWDQHAYNKPEFATLNSLLSYCLHPVEIFTNDPESCEWLVSSMERIFETRIKIRRLPDDIEFLEEAWDRVSSRVFPLLNGGSILIEETSACTTIDINAGSDQSFTNVNREVMRVLPKILYQGRYGGKIVVDMLPIPNREESERLVRQFESEWSALDVSAQLFGVSKMGLLEFILPRRGYPLGWIDKNILKN
ncbi:ribonuclease E/G [Candidatus Bodocaedibacter vickermanii]|uniref:Ribonuclease, Rne/Rng family n=1 Tax=Candidatus Bodocaedibacter vickermanii TaxID=2741701 RepID=A0A7L9RTT1_9PROT|nr:Ribonuclease, Rne/Rng family [Candidatus Paracaedibacteraceae bacterium 'Lake Konstanz']